jgi:SAM-dependent methyltransferase
MIQNKSHNTAKARKQPSAPIKLLQEQNLIRGRVLDYGCGRGYDAIYYGFEMYDPYWWNFKPKGYFDTVVCNYVLNVVDEETEKEILSSIKRYLKKNGVAYIAVRRDLKEWGVNSKGQLQRDSRPDLPIVKENSKFCIYKMER